MIVDTYVLTVSIIAMAKVIIARVLILNETLYNPLSDVNLISLSDS